MTWDRWEQLAFLARYGHQDITSLLGRRPSPLETAMLSRALLRFLETERQAPPDGI